MGNATPERLAELKIWTKSWSGNPELMGYGFAVVCGGNVEKSPFELGEILLLTGDGREPDGDQRKPSKWAVLTEWFGEDYDAATRRSEDVKAGNVAMFRYEIRETDPGFGVWDRERVMWVEPEMGETTDMSERDAEDLAHMCNAEDQAEKETRKNR